jgi:hypothetical protein
LRKRKIKQRLVIGNDEENVWPFLRLGLHHQRKQTGHQNENQFLIDYSSVSQAFSCWFSP